MFDSGQGVAIKVCGLTSPEDALVCAELGVEMLGLNFSPQSLRCLSRPVAAAIVAAVRPRFPATKFVGVFVDQEMSFLRAAVQELALDAVQLHGDESAEDARELEGIFVIRAVRVRSDLLPALEDFGDAILLDTWNAQLRGGTGEVFDWSIARQLRGRIRRLILAGGLTSENVAEAIRLVQPDAVDTCSGVEDSPGRKNAGKVRRFVEAARMVRPRR